MHGAESSLAWRHKPRCAECHQVKQLHGEATGRYVDFFEAMDWNNEEAREQCDRLWKAWIKALRVLQQHERETHTFRVLLSSVSASLETVIPRSLARLFARQRS